MKIKRICIVCGGPFWAKKTNQFFCQRKCFKRDYYIKAQIKQQAVELQPSFPTRRCELCGKVQQLDFDPTKAQNKYNSLSCPQCGVTNTILLKYQDLENSFELIMKELKTMPKYTPTVDLPKYQRYHIPISRPEQCDSNVLVLAYEVVNIIALRKKSKKKTMFS